MGKLIPFSGADQEINKEDSLFSEIFQSCYSDLYHYGLKISRDEELTKDCIQDLFASLWKNREQLPQILSVKFYLIKSLRRSIIKSLQKNQKKIHQAGLFSYYEPDIEFSHEDMMIGEEAVDKRKRDLMALINSLPKRQREVIYLKYYEDLSYEEIAEMLELNYQSVLNHIHKAIKTMRGKGMLPVWISILLFIQAGKGVQKKYFKEKEYKMIKSSSIYQKHML